MLTCGGRRLSCSPLIEKEAGPRGHSAGVPDTRDPKALLLLLLLKYSQGLAAPAPSVALPPRLPFVRSAAYLPD